MNIVKKSLLALVIFFGLAGCFPPHYGHHRHHHDYYGGYDYGGDQHWRYEQWKADRHWRREQRRADEHWRRFR